KSAGIAARAGDMDTAERYNQYLREQFPNHAGGYIQRAELAMQAEDWPAARDYWHDVRKRYPNRPVGFNRGADVYEKLGNTRLAKRLRLARDYGPEWLQQIETEENVG